MSKEKTKKMDGYKQTRQNVKKRFWYQRRKKCLERSDQDSADKNIEGRVPVSRRASHTDKEIMDFSF